MKAAFCTGSGKFDIREVARPDPRPGEARLRVKACGICGSDKREFNSANVKDRISGHEISGVVEQTNKAKDIAVGDEVVVDPLCFCGECRYCLLGCTSFCKQPKGVVGYGAGGGFAEHVCVPLTSLCPKPASIDFAEASMTEPLGVALRGASQTDVAGHDCIVFGAGAIGSMLAQVLALRGANRVYVVDIHDTHLAAARQLGDFVTINAGRDADWSVLSDADLRAAYDVVGKSAEVLKKAVAVLQQRGTLVLIGVQEPGVLTMDDIENKTLSLIRSAGVHITEMREAVSLLGSGQVKVGPLITGRFPLDRIEGAFEASLTGIKVVVEP